MNRNPTIIIAEDDAVNRKVTLLMLKKLGIRAKAVGDGREVLRVLEKRFYDIVLMDIQMLGMNGIEANKIIRESWPQDRRIIVISDCDSTIYGKRCLEAGADQFLAKPLKIAELAEAIEHDMPRAFAELDLAQPSIARLSA